MGNGTGGTQDHIGRGVKGLLNPRAVVREPRYSGCGTRLTTRKSRNKALQTKTPAPRCNHGEQFFSSNIPDHGLRSGKYRIENRTVKNGEVGNGRPSPSVARRWHDASSAGRRPVSWLGLHLKTGAGRGRYRAIAVADRGPLRSDVGKRASPGWNSRGSPPLS